ncbi:hypothetical protein [Vannielia litorea]|uniref:Uncharacterized protein n=1 Tax=Vannielia litorea TaxID=1217970 RepID=A0A1N6FJE8_9RHOB|nr:hypothetical protein [Vannielia litorea]SIN95381.1 hypothetical protein SAMN05444002_1717 [Vannielia litorea]
MMAGAALAEGPEGGPELGFFEGRYEVVGRGPDGGLVEDPVRLVVEGEALRAEGCAGPAGRLAWGRVHESWRLKGDILGWEVRCTYAVDAGNYPQLLCAGPDAVRLMAWPEPEFGGPLTCP